ncbi:hypothetical protein N9R79_11585, partial [Vibrio sp.]|nr:hypothetical protein [Vibrio sp.]
GDEGSQMKSASGWLQSGRVLAIEIVNSYKISLKVLVGPGDQEITQHLLNISTDNLKSFGSKNTLKNNNFTGKKWNAVYSEEWIKKSDVDKKDIEQLKESLESNLRSFLKDSYPVIKDFFHKKVQNF